MRRGAVGEREVAIRRAVSRVQSAFPAGTGAWSRTRFEAWVAAVIDIEPDAVTTAATDLIKEWADDHGRPPQPGHLRSRSLAWARIIRSDRQRMARYENAQGEGDFAPAWYERMCWAVLILSIRARGEQVVCPPRQAADLQIAD